MSVISNTTVISNFASVGQVDLLQRLYGEISIAVDVYQEIQLGLEEGYEFYSGIDRLVYPTNKDGWLRLTSLADEQEIAIFSNLPSALHQGEASSLAIAQNRNWLLLTDDKSARKAAVARGVSISGTLGCLVLGAERDLWTLSEGNHWLMEIIGRGFFSPVVDLENLVNKT